MQVSDTFGDFDDAAATVSCIQLGLAGPGKAVRSSAYFGVGKGSQCLDEVACTGTEPGLQWCAYSINRYCDDRHHKRDVAIFCNGLIPP